MLTHAHHTFPQTHFCAVITHSPIFTITLLSHFVTQILCDRSGKRGVRHFGPRQLQRSFQRSLMAGRGRGVRPGTRDWLPGQQGAVVWWWRMRKRNQSFQRWVIALCTILIQLLVCAGLRRWGQLDTRKCTRECVALFPPFPPGTLYGI